MTSSSLGNSVALSKHDCNNARRSVDRSLRSRITKVTGAVVDRVAQVTIMFDDGSIAMTHGRVDNGMVRKWSDAKFIGPEEAVQV